MSKPTRRDKQMQIKCYALAYHFEKGMRNAHDLADHLNTRHELVRRWHKRDEFHEALDTLGFTGDRKFTRRRRDVTREQPQAYEAATRIYQQLTDAGMPKDQRIKEVAHLLGGQYSVQRINSWIKRYLDELNSPVSEKRNGGPHMKKQTARALRKNLRLEFAAHHFVFNSKSAKDISKVILVSPEKICRWCSTPEWRNSLKLWGYGNGCPFVTDFYDYAKSSFDSLTERWENLFDGEIPSFSDLSVFDVKKGD